MILAGGAGSRLWPIANARSPKPFAPLVRTESLFRLTVERLTPVVGASRILVIAGREHAAWIRRQAPEIPTANVIIEDEGRDTAASVALAALRLRRTPGDAVMIVAPADHMIVSSVRLRASLRRAVRAMRRVDGLLCIGVPPRSAETGFGYISVEAPGVAVTRATAFTEKPTAARALRLVRSGALWNSGIFVWKTSTILRELDRRRPDILRPLETWSARARALPWRVPAEVMRRVSRSSIDRAVLEGCRRLYTTRATFGWSDVGTLAAAGELFRSDRRGNGGAGRVIAIDAYGCKALNTRGLTVFLGVRDVIAARSGDAVLICRRADAQRVREVTARLRGVLGAYA